jgi:magnesium-transporting ATPase (P-type)
MNPVANWICLSSGDNAEIGKINALVSTVETVKTNLLIQMEILGRWLATIVVLIALGAFLLAFLHAKEPFVEAFESAVAIAGEQLSCQASQHQLSLFTQS